MNVSRKTIRVQPMPNVLILLAALHVCVNKGLKETDLNVLTTTSANLARIIVLHLVANVGTNRVDMGASVKKAFPAVVGSVLVSINFILY